MSLGVEESEISKSMPMVSSLELSPVLIPYFIAFFLYVGIFSNFPLYIQITQNLSEVETVEIWAIISAIALTIGAVTRVPAGILSDKIGRIPAFLLAYFVYFISLLTILLIENNIIYVVAMGLIRFGSNMVAMTGRSIVSTMKRDRGLGNGLLQSAAGLGSFVGPVTLGYVLERYQPETIIYVAIGVLIFDLFLFFGLYLTINHWIEGKEIESDLDYGSIQRVKVDFREVMRKDGIKEVWFLFFMGGLAFGLLLSIYSIYGYNRLALGTTLIGFITGIGSFSQTIAAPLAGRLYQFVKDEYMRIASWIVLTISTIMVSFSNIFIVFYYIAFFILNIGLSSYFVIEITRVSKIVEEEEFSFTFGIASSLVILATAIAGAISPYLYNILPEANFYIASVTCLISLGLVLYTTPKWMRKRSETNLRGNES